MNSGINVVYCRTILSVGFIEWEIKKIFKKKGERCTEDNISGKERRAGENDSMGVSEMYEFCQ